MSEGRGRMLPEPEAAALLGEYGIAYPAHAYVRSADEAAKAANLIGYPIVLKVVSPDAIHKSPTRFNRWYRKWAIPFPALAAQYLRHDEIGIQGQPG